MTGAATQVHEGCHDPGAWVEVRDRTFAGVVSGLPSLDPRVLSGVQARAYAADGTVLQTGPVS
ncbi:hypothetical protein [Saccharothrix sp.]|uniref:hypothetical protein n=1 Tax=Saccharothrix sp. TaxID=1873460 RepID=UPI002810D50B|nr:hypothetical protein [Saccharothrix sp.]